MNVAAHQEKEKNGKTNKRKAGEERRQATDFKEVACYPSAVVQGLHSKKMVCVREGPGVTATLGKANSHFNPTQTGLDRITALSRLLIGAVNFARFTGI